MRHSLLLSVAGVALASVVVAGQAANLERMSKLRNPAALKEQAPPIYKVNFDTSKGPIVIEVHREWAPLGADRFYNLVKNGFYDEVRFFRVVPNFMAQFGMNGNPAITKAWANVPLKDEPTKQTNKKGYVSYGRTGAPNSRTTQIFINFKDNSYLDAQGFAPFGQVVSGMENAEQITAQYGQKPSQAEITTSGNAYLNKQFPKLDYIKTATIVQ